MAIYKILLLLTLVYMVQAQRPSYAGFRAIGFPQIESNGLTNRFSESEDAPIEAGGDRNLINRLNTMPVDNQPFWYLNWRQYDALRRNPQSYTIRPSFFADNNRI